MSRRLTVHCKYLIPGFFGSLVFFCLPHAAGGYRVVKWACAGCLLCLLTLLLYRSVERLRLPSGALFLCAAALLPLSLAFSLFTDETVVAITLAGILRYCTGCAFFLLAGSIWSSLEQRHKEVSLLCLLVIAALATIPLMVSFYGMYREGRIFESGITGTFGNPNWAAGYFTAAIPFALFFLFAVSGNRKRWIASLSFILLAAGIAVSFSKTAVVTGMVIVGVSLFVFSKNSIMRKAVLPCGALLCLFFVYRFHQTILVWLEPRLFIWKALLISLQDTRLIGNGALQALRCFEMGAVQVIGGDMNCYMPSSQVDFVHNEYLQALAEGGIVGLISMIALVVLTLVKAYRSKSVTVHAAGLSFVALCINGCGDAPLQVPVTFYFWCFLAAVIWFDGHDDDAYAVRHCRVVKTVLVLCFVLFFIEGGRNALGSWFWTQSGATTTLVQQKKALQRAVLFLPEAGNVQTEYAQALLRSRQYREARAQALRARAVKFDYDDLYVITEADVKMKVIDPVPAWQDIAERFPCLNYPRYKLAEFYLSNNEYEQSRKECYRILENACPRVNPRRPYAAQAGSIIAMIDSAGKKERHERSSSDANSTSGTQ